MKNYLCRGLQFLFCSVECLYELYFNSFLLLVQENQELLIKCISQDLGFSGGKPVSACLIYKCLLHWRSFEVERTSIFDRIIQTIGASIEVIHKPAIPYFVADQIHSD